MHHVLEFAHVAGPRVGFEAGSGGVIDLEIGPQEVARERQHVFDALPQRGQLDRHDLEAIQQVGAEPTGLDLGREIAIRRSDDAHVDVHGLVAADPLELLFLEHAQQLALHRRRHLADLVEEQRAARPPARKRADSTLVPDRAGEGSGLTWPKSSLSSSDSGIAAQLSLTNGPSWRSLQRCTMAATHSLPVPLSPCTSTVA